MKKRSIRCFLAYLIFWEGILIILFPPNVQIVTAASVQSRLQTSPASATFTASTTLDSILTVTPLPSSIPAISTPPAISIPPSPTTTPVLTITPAISAPTEEDDWKSNQGTITLGQVISYTGNGISSHDSTINITKGGEFTITGFLNNGQIYVDTTEKVRLRLNEVNITSASGPAINIANAKKAWIYLVEGTNNILADSSVYLDDDAKGTVFSNDSLVIHGEGNLVVYGNYKHGIVSDDDISIKSGNITVSQAVSNSLHANNNITITGGTLKLIASINCIKSEGTIVLSGGALSLASDDKAITAVTDCTVNDGTITILKATEGIESKENLIINNGVINAVTSDDGLNAGISLSINGGSIYLNTGGDGIDSKGWLKVTGGSSIIYSGGGTDGITDCEFNPFTITGGTIIGMGGNTVRPHLKSSTQCSVALSGATANDIVSIQDSDGNEILHYVPIKTYGTMLFTSPLLKLNTKYIMYLNNKPSITFTTNSISTVAGGYAYGGRDWTFPPVSP